MEDVMDPELASKIECFLSRKRAKYQLFNFDNNDWNDTDNQRAKALNRKLSMLRR